jgi:hypothetical protein
MCAAEVGLTGGFPMATYSLDLLFQDDRKSDIPFIPRAFVYLKIEAQQTEGGPYTLTPNCVSMQEMDNHIDRLHEELEEIRKKARVKFEAEDERYRK